MSSILPTGSFPTMITPFLRAEGSAESTIDYPIVARLVEWYLKSGCVGIFSPCLSSEMYDLSPEERVQLAKFIHVQVKRRCAVVSTGTYGGAASIEEMAAFTKQMAQYCDAVVVITCHFDPENKGDDVWRANCEKFLEKTPGLNLGLYECPVPYKRVLSPELLSWAVSTGRFFFHKDTCCDKKEIKAKLQAVQKLGDTASSFRFFNANVETLVYSTVQGGAGFSGISANFYPHLHAWMIKAIQSEAFGTDEVVQGRVQDVQDFFSLAELTVCINYPASPKQYLRSFYESFPISPFCRKFARSGAAQPRFSEQDMIRLEAMHRQQRNLSKRLGIVEHAP